MNNFGIDQLIGKVNYYILNPFIAFLFVLATLLFLMGVVQFYIAGDDKTREDGRRHVLWGLVGMFIMISVFGIMKLLLGTFGVDIQQLDSNIPTRSVFGGY